MRWFFMTVPTVILSGKPPTPDRPRSSGYVYPWQDVAVTLWGVHDLSIDATNASSPWSILRGRTLWVVLQRPIFVLHLRQFA
jgi:hypothetical protein